jgi:hypothetical protein
VLLDASGCPHWLDRPVPTRLDLAELRRILSPEPARAAPRLPAVAACA